MTKNIIEEPSDFSNTPLVLSNYLGDTLVDANGYSGIIEISASSSVPHIDDTETPDAGLISWMGSLEVGNVGSASVSILIATDSTDLGLFNFSPSNGVQNIFLYGNYDSLSMSSYDLTTNNASGESLDLSGANVYTYDQSSSSWQNKPITIFGTNTGNDHFLGSSGINVLYEGSGNSTFQQSAGSDLIQCSGGNSVYYAKDAIGSYVGAWQDSSTGQRYYNQGEHWIFQENGQTIELVNVPKVYFNGVEYDSAVNNQSPSAANNATSTLNASTAGNVVHMSDVLNQGSLHQAMLNDFGHQGFHHASSATSASGAPENAVASSVSTDLAGYSGLLMTDTQQATGTASVSGHHGSSGTHSFAA